jgi:hypothetical protein
VYQAYSTDPRVNVPTVRKPVTRSGFSLADTLSDSAGVAYADKLKLAPEEIAQHAFAGPDMEAFLSNLAGKKVIMGGGTSRPRGRSLAEPMVPAGGSDGGYQNAVNAYLSELTDRNAAGQAQHEAQFADEQKQQDVARAMAIANDPNTSQFGRPIVPDGPMALGPSGRPVSASGTYATAPPAENAPPVNRQAVAAQMAPGLIAPPPAGPGLTFGAPTAAMVNGKRVFVRPGSDGQMYDMSRRPVASDALEPQGDQNEPLVSVMGPDNRPVLVPRSQAAGKTPASSREQGRPVTSGDAGRITELDTSLDDLRVLRDSLGTTGAGSKIGAMLPNVVTEVTGIGSDSKSRQGTIDRVKQVIGKALEGGVLRKEDEVKYEKILPTIGDPPDVAKAKLDGLEKALIQRRQRTLESLADAGYETSRFEGRSGAPASAKPSGAAKGADPLGIR